MERIDKLLSSQGRLSRNDVKKLIRAKQVYCNGELVSSAAQKIDTDKDVVTLDGEPVTFSTHSYIMLNKPQNVISSTEKGQSETVIDLVPEELFRKGLFPAGRLDKDSTGFVLLTNDGAFAHSILSPKNHVPKTYEVEIPVPLTEDEIRQIQDGLVVGDTSFLPAEVRFLNSENGMASYEIVIYEGKYHQVKRMFAHFKKDVISLHRTKIGDLNLDPALPSGSCRLISKDELELTIKPV